MTFRITTAALDAVELSGAGSIHINNLDTEQWQVMLPGAGSITVSGQMTGQMVELSGAGSYDAENLESQEATIPGAAQYQVIILESGTSTAVFTEKTTVKQMPLVSLLPQGVNYTWTVQAQDAQGNVLGQV